MVPLMSHLHRRAYTPAEIGIAAQAAYEQHATDLGKYPADAMAWENLHEDTRNRWRRNIAAALLTTGAWVPKFDEPFMPQTFNQAG